MPEDKNEKKDSKIAKVEVDRALCIGAASCVAVAPDVFELDSENKAVVKDPKGADDDTVILAAQSCPVHAIKIIGKDGKQIVPE